MEYGQLTIRQLIDILTDYAKELPNGMDTLVTSGDFEGNYTHGSHEVQIDREHGTVFIGYEMHENCEDELPILKEIRELNEKITNAPIVTVSISIHGEVNIDDTDIKQLLQNMGCDNNKTRVIVSPRLSDTSLVFELPNKDDVKQKVSLIEKYVQECFKTETEAYIF